MERIIGQWWRKQNVAQQHRHAHRDGAPVVELLGGDASGVEEVHPDHHQTGDIEQIEHQFGPRFLQSVIKYAIEHHAHREHTSHGGNHDIKNLSILLESCLHFIEFLC